LHERNIVLIFVMSSNEARHKKIEIMTTIIRGTKLKLNIDGVIRIYEVRWIEDNNYTIFNKYVTSSTYSLDFILKNLVD